MSLLIQVSLIQVSPWYCIYRGFKEAEALWSMFWERVEKEKTKRSTVQVLNIIQKIPEAFIHLKGDDDFSLTC